MKETLKSRELTSILINIILIKTIISYPRKIMESVGNSAWIVSLYITVLMLIILFLINKIYNYSEPILEKAYKSGGKIFRYVIGISITFMLILSMTSIVRLYPESVKIILLPKTPIEIIVFILGIASVLGVFCGINAIGRISYVFIPLSVIIMAFSIILLIPHMNINNLTPISGYGIKENFLNGTTFLSSFADIIVLFILPVQEKDRKKLSVTGYASILISGIIMTIIMLCYCMVFPHGVSEDFLMPYYQLTRVAQIGEMFTRIEALFEFIWTILVMLYFSIYLYVISNVWAKIFNLKYHKPLAVPFMITVSFLALLPSIYLDFDDNFSWYSLAMIFISIGVPIIVGIADNLKKRKVK